jgi:hypothetical protein
VFLWRSGGHGHTGIVESVDDDGTVHTIEAYGTKEGTGRFERSLSDFTGHKGFKGFFRPKSETADGKFDKKGDSKKDKKDSKGKKSSINVTFDNGKTRTSTTVDPNDVNSWGDFWRNVNTWMNW